MSETLEWKKSSPQTFWGEVAQSDHVLQIYKDENAFLDLLEEYVRGGIMAGDGIIVIATSTHLNALEDRLISDGYNISTLKVNDQYLALNAHETLAKFMVNGWPDKHLFMKTVSQLIVRVRKKNRQIRAFGEMVAILWEQGNRAATIHLENLWNQFCATDSFCLLCAYPQCAFPDEAHQSMVHICGQHNRQVTGVGKPKSEILYSSPTTKKAD